MASTHRLRTGPITPTLVLATALALLLAVWPLANEAQAGTTTQLEAADNVGAALAWSQLTLVDGTADEVLLARDNLFADSLASGSAQGRNNAPLLLTGETSVDPRVVAELERLGAETVFILGGNDALAGPVETELDALGYETERVFGPTRIETAVAVTDAFFPTTTRAIIARAYAGGEPTQAFADSMATGAYSAGTNLPVLYTQTEVLTRSTREYLESSLIDEVGVAGGAEAVSDAVVAELEALGIEVTRLSGSNRFGTAVAMSADLSFESAGRADRVLLVDSTATDSWASGFAAAAQAAGGGAPLVLSAGDTLPDETRDFLSDADGRVSLVCGPYTSTAACDAASEAVGNQ